MHRNNRRLCLVFVCLALAGAAIGCASVTPVPPVDQAEVHALLEAARFTGAAGKCPYDFTLARLYYEQALTETERGNLDLAQRYLHEAHKHAAAAYAKARKYRAVR